MSDEQVMQDTEQEFTVAEVLDNAGGGEPDTGGEEPQPEPDTEPQQEPQQDQQQEPEPEIPDWLLGPQPGQQPQQKQAQQPGGGIDPEALKAVLEVLAAQSQQPEHPQATDESEILSRLLTNPKSVLEEVVSPLRQQLEAVQRFTEMQTTAQMRLLADSARQRMAEGFKREVVRHPLYAGDEEVRRSVDEIAQKALTDAVTSSLRDGAETLTELGNPDYPLLIMALGAYKAGKLRQFLGQHAEAPPQAARAAEGQPASPGAAAQEAGPGLPKSIDEATLHALRGIGITEDQVRAAIAKHGWED